MAPNRILIIAAISLQILSLTACDAKASDNSTEANVTKEGPNGDSSDSIATTKESTAVSSGVDPSGQTVVFWHAWDFGPAAETMAVIIERFNASNEWGITVNAVVHDSHQEISNNFKRMGFAEESPNIIAGFNYQLIGWNLEESILVDLSAYVGDAYVGFDEEDISDFYPVIWEQDIVGGKRLGIPAQEFGQVILYNRTWAEELGFHSQPETPEQMKLQACAAADSNDDGTGGLLLSTEGVSVAGWIYAFGGNIEAEQDTYDFNNSETQATFDFLDDMHAEGCAWEAKSLYPNREFASRQGLFFASSVVGLNIQAEVFENLSSDDEWTVIPFPSPAGSPIIPVYGVSLAMVASTPEAQLATWMFMRYFLESTNQVMWTIVGENFPIRRSVLDSLGDYAIDYPQWAAAINLLEYGKSSPRVSSWGAVRFVLQDAAKELFRSKERYNPQLLEDLESTAKEVHAFYGK